MATVANTTAWQPATGSKKLLLLAILLGLIAAALNWLYLSSVESSTVTVLKVKGQPIPAGTLVSKNMFQPIKISGNLKELQGLVVTENDFPAFDQKPIAQSLQVGELLLLRSFDISGEHPVRDSIKPGERALSINVADEAGAVSYFVRPGDSVDIWGRVGGTAYKLKERSCVKAVGESHTTLEAGGGAKGGVVYRTITVVVAETDVASLIQNVALAGDGVTLSLVGSCDSNAPNIPALPPLADPKAKATPSPQMPGRAEVPGASPSPARP